MGIGGDDGMIGPPAPDVIMVVVAVRLWGAQVVSAVSPGP
jgi:hypothetical protein